MRPRTRIVLLALCLCAALFALAYPVYVIRPFRPQGPVELDVALRLLRIRPALLILALLAGTGIAAADWRATTGRLRKIGLATAVLLIAAAGVLSRINIFEKMFHPIDAPAFQPAAATTLDPSDKVLAVLTRAYPIRALAYHHIVNDTVDGIPLVGTY